MSKISWVAYVTDDNGSLAKTGRASRLGSSVWPSRSEASFRPTSTRLEMSPSFGTICNRRPCRNALRPVNRKRMQVHVVIMGCGRVGSTLAHSLEARDHTVAVVDQNPEAFRRLQPGFGGFTVAGVGFDREVLREAGIERAGAFAAVSSGDNSNIIAARVARETFGVHNVVARI